MFYSTAQRAITLDSCTQATHIFSVISFRSQTWYFWKGPSYELNEGWWLADILKKKK